MGVTDVTEDVLVARTDGSPRSYDLAGVIRQIRSPSRRSPDSSLASMCPHRASS